jgi:hypothetical protein
MSVQAVDSMVAFRRICKKFEELACSTKDEAIPVYGGIKCLIKYWIHYPIRSHIRIVKNEFNSQFNVNAIDVFFPVDSMLNYLGRFQEHELKSLKKISEINLREKKDQLTDNFIFKITVPIGSAYALLKVSDKLIQNDEHTSLFMLKEVLKSGFMQGLLDTMLVTVIIAFIILAFQYIFVFSPSVARAQLLDDMIMIAIQEKNFVSEISSEVK